MRNALSLTNVHLPAFPSSIPVAQSEKIQKQLKAWDESDFAGYRRLITPGSDCYPDFAAIKALAKDRAKGATGKPIRDFVLLGTGGSSLGGETIMKALQPQGAGPRFHFMDNNDPDHFGGLLKTLHPEETLVYVVSKSGKTPETISQFLSLIPLFEQKVGDKWKHHFVLCTDPKSGDLRALANKSGLAGLTVPSPVGGRFSVFTPVGLFPAAFAGLEIEAFLEGARSVQAWDKSPTTNPCAQLALALVAGLRERPITVLMPYSTRLGAFSRWFCQLWAESLGKEGKGFTPYPAVGTTDQHSQVQLYMEGPKDKAILLVRVKEFGETLPLQLPAEMSDLPSFAELKGASMLDLFDAEYRATRDAFTNQGVANATIEVDRLDTYSLGALFYFWEWATAIAGAEMGINPFNQPGVENAKILTKKYLRERGK